MFNKFDKLLLMAEGQGMHLGDVKNCKALPTIPTETFAVVTRSEDECRQRIKSIENQRAENIKRLRGWGEQFWLAIRSYPRSCWASSSAPNTRSRS